MEKDPAILFKLDSCDLCPSTSLWTPDNFVSLNRCRCCKGKNGASETYVYVEYEIFNLCKTCSKSICIMCPNRKTNAFDKVKHVCNDCKNENRKKYS